MNPTLKSYFCKPSYLRKSAFHIANLAYLVELVHFLYALLQLALLPGFH